MATLKTREFKHAMLLHVLCLQLGILHISSSFSSFNVDSGTFELLILFIAHSSFNAAQVSEEY